MAGSTFKVEVRDVDVGWSELRKGLAEIGGVEVKAGIIGDVAQQQHGNSGLTNAELGAVHEFGGGNVPERSFLRSSFDANRPKYDDLLRKLEQAVYMNRAGVRGALDLLGSTMAADMRARIRAGIAPALAPATIARKTALGRKDPALALVDTRQLINAISSEVQWPGAVKKAD